MAGYPDFEESCGYGSVTGIGGANCRHSFYPYIEGVSERRYTDAELEAMKPENRPKTVYEGREYDDYQATQMQRRIEREIRKEKRRQTAYKAAGLDDDAKNSSIRLRRLNTKYQEFSKAAGLKTQYERTKVAKVGGRQKSVLERLNFAQGTTEMDRLSIEQEVAQIPQRARELAEPYIFRIVVTDEDRSGYRPATGELFLNRDREPGTVAHEYAHALEKALGIYEDPEFLKIREKGFENLTVFDIIEDAETFNKPIVRVWSEKLVSIYQGRLYDRFGRGIYDGGHIYLDGMREYFSEGFMFYVNDPEVLRQKDPDLFDYIRRLLK